MTDAATYHEDIRSAFRRAVMQALPGWDQWEWENEAYKPETGRPYIRERIVPVSSLRPSVGIEEHVTLCMVTLFAPPGGGTRGPAHDTVGKIISAFPPRLSLQYGANKALVTKVERKALVVEPGWVSTPIIVSTLGHTIVAV